MCLWMEAARQVIQVFRCVHASLSEVSNALPGLEPNAEEAPDFKEAIMNALRRKQEVFSRTNALLSRSFLASLIFHLHLIFSCII